MKTQQRRWSNEQGWTISGEINITPQLVIFFSSPRLTVVKDVIADLTEIYTSRPLLVGCTTGGEILGDELFDESLIATALEFEHSTVRHSIQTIAGSVSSFECGASIARDLDSSDLKAIMVFSDGTLVNGSQLTQGLNSILGGRVPVIGGLAGDGADFAQTRLGVNGGFDSGIVIGIGLYGEKLAVSHGSAGGWDSFGPTRRVTRSEGNVLYELDGEPALDLYIRYLGEWSANLPSSALLFPLSVALSDDIGCEVVRTILNVDREQKSMTFAGDIPNQSRVRLMKATLDQLVDAAAVAAQEALGLEKPKFAMLVSCIGRRLVLSNRAVEEIEIVVDTLGKSCAVMGFYSYGEICPVIKSGPCELHNQTMTITTINEAD